MSALLRSRPVAPYHLQTNAPQKKPHDRCTQPQGSTRDRAQDVVLLVEPHVFQAPSVVDAVLVQHVTFDVRMPTNVASIVEDDRVCNVLRKLALDLPHQGLALAGIG